MAQQDQRRFCCSICLDLLKDPVTIPCGHNYCMGCIKSYWGEKDQTETHNCPQCRQFFTPRPALVKNNMLSDLVEELKKTEAASADECSAGPGDVVCDFCTGIKVKAQKSCLQCLVSYCEEHLQPHYKSPAFEKHKLVDPARGFQENICSHHNEVMKIFCRTDQKCICILCSMDEHKGHNMVSSAAEVAQKLKELGVSRQRIQQRIQIREKDLNVLQQEVEAVNNCADNAVRDSEMIITEVKQQIRSRQITEVSRAIELQEKLEQEIAELRRKDTELQQLSGAEDHTKFLNKYLSLTTYKPTDSPSISIHPLRYSEDVTAAVSGARDKLQDVLTEEWSKISLTDSGADVLLSQPEPKTREDFQKYAQEFTLNPNTAGMHLLVDRTYVVHIDYSPHYNNPDMYKKPVHPDRFTSWPQVLCSETLTGRCYWEVEWHGEVFVAVAYKKLSRIGNESILGNNDMSWALQCSDNQSTNYYEFRHENIRTSISGPHSSRIGVYVDHSAGMLSFYSISDTMTLLHTVQTRFTQPLCPGFGVYLPKSNASFGTSGEEKT